MSNNKVYMREIDVMRFIAVILVVVGHSAAYQCVNEYENINYDLRMLQNNITDTVIHHDICRLSETIYLFHMPLFFAISGATFAASMLAKKDGHYLRYPTVVSLIKEKGKKLLIPYIIVTLFWDIPLKYWGGVYNNCETKTEFYNNAIQGQLLLKGNSYLWFLIALFNVFLIVYLLEKYIKNSVLNVYILVLIHFMKYGFSNNFTYTAMDNALYFYIGYTWITYREKYNTMVRKNKYIIWISSLTLILIEYIKNIWRIPNLDELLRYWGIGTGMVLIYSVALKLTELNFDTWKIVKIINGASFGIFLYAEPINYFMLRKYIDVFSISILGSEVGAFFLFLLRTLGVTVGAMIIVKTLKKVNLKILC